MQMRTLAIIAVVVVLALAGWWWFSGEETYPITNERPGGTAVIALGDSITAGAGAGEAQSWPAQLSQRLGVDIVNAGVSGNTTADGLARVERDVLARDPRIVIVCLGGNDLLRRVPREETMRNLEAIVKRIQEKGALVILVGLDPVIGSSFASDMRELARRTGCPYVPDVLGGIMDDSALMSDQIHPNAQGYAKMADKIEPVLKRYLEPAE